MLVTLAAARAAAAATAAAAAAATAAAAAATTAAALLLLLTDNIASLYRRRQLATLHHSWLCRRAFQLGLLHAAVRVADWSMLGRRRKRGSDCSHGGAGLSGKLLSPDAPGRAAAYDRSAA